MPSSRKMALNSRFGTAFGEAMWRCSHAPSMSARVMRNSIGGHCELRLSLTASLVFFRWMVRRHGVMGISPHPLPPLNSPLGFPINGSLPTQFS
jgi:hypothetical protein